MASTFTHEFLLHASQNEHSKLCRTHLVVLVQPQRTSFFGSYYKAEYNKVLCLVGKKSKSTDLVASC